MTTWIGFLRAINLGKTRQFPKDAIRAAVEVAGGSQVETYINTGNVRFSTRQRSRARIEEALERAFLADRGFQVPTICFTPVELRALAAALPPYDGGGRRYVELLRDEPAADVLALVEAAPGLDLLGPRALLLTVPEGSAPGPAIPGAVVRCLGVTTNRNIRVIAELASRWGS